MSEYSWEAELGFKLTSRLPEPAACIQTLRLLSHSETGLIRETSQESEDKHMVRSLCRPAKASAASHGLPVGPRLLLFLTGTQGSPP